VTESLSPTLELLLPFYGDPELFRETVRSVLRQTDQAWTLLIIDDCYPDPSIPEWVAALSDPRVHYCRNERNLGANATYQIALSRASGDYVALIGADDVLRPTFVSHVRTRLTECPVDILHPGVAVIDGAGQRHSTLTDRIKSFLRPGAGLIPAERAVRSLMHGNWTYFPSIVWRRDKVINHGLDNFNVVQDLALLVGLLRSGATFVIDDEVVFEYRRHRLSDSAVKSLSGERFDEEALYYRGISDELTAQGWNRAAWAARMRWSSRLNALASVPRATKSSTGKPAKLLRHAVLW
jgi:glycosyltransferase involved in cell wall biosynthesis